MVVTAKQTLKALTSYVESCMSGNSCVRCSKPNKLKPFYENSIYTISYDLVTCHIII